MRVVLGLSLTAGSAVWVVVDTYDGRIIADEVVPLESLNEIARAAARSVQAFALQSDEDIDGVRLVWDADARQHGIRLRTKLRLFGFDTVDTVSEEAAREGRNRTARHIAPHLVLAYGAARADLDDTEDKGVLRRLVAKVSHRVPVGVASGVASGVSLRLTAAASVAAIALIGLALYSFVGRSPAPQVTDTSVAGAVAPAPPAGAAPVAPQPAPQAIVAPQPAAQVVEPTFAAAAPEEVQMPEYSSEPVVSDYDTAVPQVAEVPDTTTIAETPAIVGLGSTVSEELPTAVEAPHLTGIGPAAGPVQSAAAPAQATPASVTPAPPAPAGPLGALFRALP